MKRLLLPALFALAAPAFADEALLARPEAGALQGEAPALGRIEVKSHVQIANGIELVIDAARAALTPQMLRQLVSGIAQLHAELTQQKPR